MKRITIEPVSRIEGHAKITVQLDDRGKVAGTEFSVTQVRGFEKFTEGSREMLNAAQRESSEKASCVPNAAVLVEPDAMLAIRSSLFPLDRLIP